MDRSLDGPHSPAEDHDQLRRGVATKIRMPSKLDDRSRESHSALSNIEEKRKSAARLRMPDWDAPYRPLNTLCAMEKREEVDSKGYSSSYCIPSFSSKMPKYMNDGDVFDLKRAESLDRKKPDSGSSQVIVVDEEKTPSRLNGLLSTFRLPSTSSGKRKNSPARITTMAKSRIFSISDDETDKSESGSGSESEGNVFESPKPKKKTSSGPSTTTDLAYMSKELSVSALQVGELRIEHEDGNDAPMTFTVNQFVSTLRVGHDRKCHEIPNSSVRAVHVQLKYLVSDN